MKKLLIATALVSAIVASAFAADTVAKPERQDEKLEQKKAEVIQHIDERISNSLAEKACVQSAQTADGLRSCRDKYRPKHRPEGQEKR